jgi:transcriptional regulator with XRE-family HTH domain
MLGVPGHGVHDPAGHGSRGLRAYHARMSNTALPHASRRLSVGDHLRHWRQLRRLSQQDLALDAELSTRHLSCVETGKASPSRELVLRLCERLAVPLRERNAWLVMDAARQAVQHILDRHEPWPAVAFDRHWNMVLSNRMVAPLLSGVDPALLQPPVNLLRVSLHPGGLAPRIANLDQWREHLFARLQQQVRQTGDEGVSGLLEELRAYPGQAPGSAAHLAGEHPGVLMPFLVHTPAGVLHLISTTTVFGSPTDITLQELALETFFPGDEATAQALRALAATMAA